MSSEVAKKRGRPKKVISDPVEVELPESTKTATTSAKSTKAATKTTKTAPAVSAKASASKKAVSKSAAGSAPAKATPKASATPAKSSPKAPEKPATSVKVTPASSKILSQVKELEAKKIALPAGVVKVELSPESAQDIQKLREKDVAKTPITDSKPSPAPVASKSTPKPAQPKSAPPPNPIALDSSKPATPPPSPAKSTPPPPSAKPTPKPHVPVLELNSAIVSNISTRAGARPNTAGSQQLPKNYKPVARKVTMVIVALPIAIVTSYVLYQRLVLGEEKKLLVPPAAKEESKVEPTSAAPSQ